jgi:hypothetical protein
MHSPCQFDKIKLNMKWRNVFTFLIIFFLFSLPLSVHARGVKPDIRNYDVKVDERLMPSKPCGGKTPAEWVASHIGFNELAGNNMKFSEYLFEMANQVDRAAVRLSPNELNKRVLLAQYEQGNPVAWVGEICWYQPDLKPPIIGSSIIESGSSITQVFKQIRDGNTRLAAFNTQYGIPLTGEIYNLQKPPLSPDPNLQSECEKDPKGIQQSPTTDKGQGINTFAPDWTLFFRCTIDISCQCEMTEMYIRTDSFIPYNTPPLCTGPGCTDKQIEQVDSQSAPTEEEKNAKGWMNGVVRIGNQPQIIEMVEMLVGTIIGKAPDQTTKNNVNDRTADSSYYTTMGHEMSMKYTNCKLFPYAKRAEMPECNTNWLSNLMVSATNQLRGTLSQNTVEPTESTASSNPVQ